MVINYVALITHYYDIMIRRYYWYGYCRTIIVKILSPLPWSIIC